MTDNEIIKALEVHLTQGLGCSECPVSIKGYATIGSPCMTLVLKGAFDLINRQKAEIEELEAEIDKQYEQAKADILGNMADGGTSCHWCINQHRAEAVKELVEIIVADYPEMEYYLDNLVKEFTEGKDEDK